MRCRLAKGSNLRPRNVINTRSDSAEWPRTTWYHIESLCPLPCIYIPIVLWSRPSVDPLTILLIKLLKSYSIVLTCVWTRRIIRCRARFGRLRSPSLTITCVQHTAAVAILIGTTSGKIYYIRSHPRPLDT